MEGSSRIGTRMLVISLYGSPSPPTNPDPPMNRRDEIDATLAKHFAWTFVPPGDSAQILERLRFVEAAAIARVARADQPLAPDPDAGATEARVVPDRSAAPAVPSEPPPRKPNASGGRAGAKAQAGCRALAAAVAHAWASTDEAACLRATKQLLGRADRLGVELLEMRDWPAEAVRLLRLLVRFGPKMTRRQRERAANVATLVPLDHPEAAELLVEMARAGDRVLVEALLSDDEWSPEVEDAALCARLADVVDDGPTHASRVVAIDLISRLDDRTAANAALRRALALPSFAVRARALQALATAERPAIEAGDLVRVLRDLVAHAVPDALSDEEHEDNERIFSEAVLAALEHVRPDEAAESLLDWIDAEHDALWLDAGWATEALAVAFPETAAAMVDHWLKCARVHDRSKALAALDRLSDDLARPRLQLAASDPSPSIRESAREQWLHRFGGVCPVELTALLGASLLRAPPDDRFVSRLVVMQGRVTEARLAMGRVLLAEAPDPDALVLLVQLVGDDTLSDEPLALHVEPSAAVGASPSGEGDRTRTERERSPDWARILVEKFGALAVDALCSLAERFPEPESFGWTRRLGDLVERGIIAREHFGALRAMAARHVASDDAGVIDDSLRLLGLVGAPAELLDRALGLALDVDLASSAVRELVMAWPDQSVDTRLASEMALAVAERDWGRVQCAASVALGRGSPAARIIAQRVLEIAEEDAAAVDAAVECANRLRTLRALDDAWALAALSRADSPIFTVAARVWRRSPLIRGALEAALVSPTFRGASRAEAAIALLWADPPLSPRDRRLTAVLPAAPPLERAELIHAMCIQGAPLGQVAVHLPALLESSDIGVTRALIGVARWMKSSKGKALLRSALPRVVDPELRADIEEELGTLDEPYWVEG